MKQICKLPSVAFSLLCTRGKGCVREIPLPSVLPDACALPDRERERPWRISLHRGGSRQDRDSSIPREVERFRISAHVEGARIRAPSLFDSKSSWLNGGARKREQGTETCSRETQRKERYSRERTPVPCSCASPVHATTFHCSPVHADRCGR